jgi:superfamily II DNA or RNA helicase
MDQLVLNKQRKHHLMLSKLTTGDYLRSIQILPLETFGSRDKLANKLLVLLFFPMLVLAGGSSSAQASTASANSCEQVFAHKTNIQSAQKNTFDFVSQTLAQLINPGIDANAGPNEGTAGPIFTIKSDRVAELNAAGPLKLDIRIEAKVTSPLILLSPTRKTLVLPLESQITKAQLEGSLRQWLVGQELHPYIGTRLGARRTSKFLQLKAFQKEALTAYEGLRARNSKSMLVVAPGGSGKSGIARQMNKKEIQRIQYGTQFERRSNAHQDLRNSLDANLQSNAPKAQTDAPKSQLQPKLIIVLSDQRLLLRQLKQTLLPESSDGPDQHTHSSNLNSANHSAISSSTWGDGHKPQPLNELLLSVQNEGKPHLLFSTTQSFKSMVLNSNEVEKRALTEATGLIVIDEGHLVGSAQMRELMPKLLTTASDNGPFVVGLTATPIHTEANIASIYQHNVFWAYLDTAKDFLSKKDSQATNRNVSQLITQLELAIAEGDITPIDRVHFLNSLDFATEKDPMFIKERADGKGRLVLNPELYSKVFARLSSLITTKAPGFITTATIEEAKRVHLFLKDSFPNKNFSILHSDLTDQEVNEIDQNLQKNKIDFVISVKMLDQGIDLPHLQTYIDLTASISPRQLVQRMARTTRLAKGKNTTQIALLLPIDENTVRESIELVDQLLLGRVRGETRTLKTDRDVIDFGDLGALKLSDVEYEQELTKLKTSLTKFWESERERTGEQSRAIRIKDLDAYIILNNGLPSQGSKDATIKSLGLFVAKLKNNSKNAGVLWYLGLSEAAIQILKDKDLLEIKNNLPPDLRLRELDAYIILNKELPSGVSKDSKIKSLGIFVQNLKNQSRRKGTHWYLGLSEAAIRILKDKDLLEIQNNQSELRLRELDAYIIQNKRLPSQSSKDATIKSLGRFAQNLKKQSRKEGTLWYLGLSDEAIRILKFKDLLEFKTNLPSDLRLRELDKYIILNNGLPSRSSKDATVNSLGMYVADLKKKSKKEGTLWYLDLSEAAIEILRKIGKL